MSMRRGGRRLAIVALLAGLAAGCESAPAVDPGPVVAAFRDCLYSYYEARTLTARPEPPLLERRARAGAALISALERKGVEVKEDDARAGLAGLAPLVERFLHTETDLAFAEIEPPAPLAPGERRRANDFPGSYLVADGVAREVGREVSDGARRARYHAVLYDRALVLPYDEWARAAPGLHRVADVVYLAREGRPSDEVERRLDAAARGLLAGP
jgi:hypothetical protein